MSQALTLAELKEKRKRVEKELQELESKMKEIMERYNEIMQEEKRLYDELRKCQMKGDYYAYSRIEMRLNVVSRNRREIENLKSETERRIKGYREDLERIDKRIEFLKPREVKFIVEKPPS